MTITAHSACRPVVDPRVEEPIGEVDAVALLDHRTRTHVVTAALAPPGRYLALEGDDGMRMIALHGPRTHIGRGLTADVRIDDHRVSRLHAIIVQCRRSVRLLDCHSLAGTLLNGRRAIAMELRDGDVIGVGPIRMRYLEIRDPVGDGGWDRGPLRSSLALRRR